jgi:glucose-1-phosphatase
MPPKFFYFDLGKVLVDFSVERMCQQIATAAGIEPARVSETLFAGGLQLAYESGRISSQEFHERFNRETGSCCPYDDLALASNAIFTLNASIVPVVAQLAAAGHRLGILSNTCPGHWQYCRERFRLLDSFGTYVLSYEVQACKPDPAIFLAAAERAGCRPEEIFYTDDLPGHVAGARGVGLDAVQYTTTPALAAELRQRGVGFNY